MEGGGARGYGVEQSLAVAAQVGGGGPAWGRLAWSRALSVMQRVRGRERRRKEEKGRREKRKRKRKKGKEKKKKKEKKNGEREKERVVGGIRGGGRRTRTAASVGSDSLSE